MVSIIIVNYNSGHYLLRCINSILAQTYQPWELVIVDNASEDASLASIKPSERLQIIQNDKNRGFASAQNQGIRVTNGEFVMSLNFDVAMQPTYLASLAKGLMEHPECGSVCGKLLRMTNTWQPTDIIDTTGLCMLYPGAPYSRGNGEIDHGQYDQETYVFGAQGTAPLYRREMLEDIAFEGQYFDENYFMWYEDVDLDWRAQMCGWKCLYIPGAVAYHIGHADDEERSDFYYTTTIRNRWMMTAANFTRQQLKKEWLKMCKYELGLIFYLVRKNKLKHLLNAAREISSHRSYLQRKRAWIQKRFVELQAEIE